MRPAPILVLVLALVFPLLLGADGLLTTFDPDVAAKVQDHDYKKAARAEAGSAAIPTERVTQARCVEGQADVFPCKGIDLLSFVPYDEFAGVEQPAFAGISDIWGWTHEESGREFVIIGVSNGVNFFEVTDPTAPVNLGKLPNHAVAQLIWHDIKVNDDHAFIVSESAPHGMTVFDLTRLLEAEPETTWDADAFYPLNVSAHNLAINPATDTAYLVGGNVGILVGDQCDAGLHMIDISDPKAPSFAGCFADDGYTHDVQCVLYSGPDREHRGKEICVASNEDTLTVVDVTDRSAPTMISRTPYDGASYTHQGWFTEDQRFFLLGDEVDELDQVDARGDARTRTMIVDLKDLDAPRYEYHVHGTSAIDHNMYTHRGLLYQSNYTAGLRVFRTSGLPSGKLREAAYFDTFPEDDRTDFYGTWSNYPYFPSGTIAVSGIDEGLFLLRLQPEIAEMQTS